MSVTLAVHLLSPFRRVTCSFLLFLILRMMSVEPICYRIPFVLFLSLKVTPDRYDSLHLPLGCDKFFL